MTIFWAFSVFAINKIEDLNRSYQNLSAKFHPDIIPRSKTGEHSEIMAFLSEIKTTIQDFGMDIPINQIPVYVKYGCEKIPILIETNGSNLELKIKKVTNVSQKTIIRPTGFEPWMVIPVIKAKVTTDMVFIKNVYSPVLSSYGSKIITNLIDEFIVGGKANFKPLIRDNGEAKMKFKGQPDLVVRTGLNISPRDLTFNRFCCLLGEFNRTNYNNLTHKIPGLSRYIEISKDIPTFFKLFLHHGVYFSWNFDLPSEHEKYINRYIYLAVKTLDMIFVNLKKIKTGEKLFESVFELLNSNNEQLTWTHDFKQFIGNKRLERFEAENNDFITKYAPKIKFNRLSSSF